MESATRGAAPLPRLALGAIGVVFGDIGTSPLYAMRACLLASGDRAVTPEQVLGILSLIFWALALTITVKYIGLVLRVDNRGEGGVLALTALSVSERTEVSPALLVALGLAGCALFFGDGSITPAVSVLSAIEGLSLIEPAFSEAVVPIAAVVLLALFWMQKRGTGAIGRVFGPIMLLWFGTLAVLGIHGIMRAPQILAAINPWYAAQFIATHGGLALAVIGGVFLAVTGGEALYADLGHFGRKPIQLAWLCIVWPGLLLNYFGQGALLLMDPEAVRSPFYMLAPSILLAPLVVLATAAAIIASQAVISGVFSLTQQALQLGFLPRVRIEQTSAQAVGQVYVPAVNWLLCLATLSLVLMFRSSDNLTNAYGIAVASTMVIESVLLAVLLHSRAAVNGRWPFLLLLPLLLIDVTFFLANAHKIPGGGWFPLLLGSIVFLVMRTWQRGRAVVAEQTRRQERSLTSFLAMIAATPPVRVDGTAVFLTSDGDGIPRTLSRNVKYNGVLHEHTILLTLSTERIPRVPRGGRLKVAKLAPGLYRLEAHLGFMEQPDVPRLLRDAERLGLTCRVDGATYFLGRDDVVIGNPRGMTPWRKHLFMFLSRNAQFAGAHFGIPPEQIIEIGGQVQI